MNNIALEYRVARLERLISGRKNEFIDRFDKPTRSEEARWVSGLFDKYKSLKSKLKTNLDSINKQNSGKPFSLILTTNDDSIRFLITTKGNRDEMSCAAFNNGDNAKIAELRRFHLNNGINEVAVFILQTIKDYIKESLLCRYSRKYEDISLTTFDCENIKQQIEDLLDDMPEVTVDINDDNSDYGFLNIGFFNPEYLIDYDIVAKDVKSFEVERDSKKVGTAKSVEDAVDLLVDKFIKDYINGKYK